MPYPQDPQLCTEILALYDSVWPGLSNKVGRAVELGGNWFEISTPVVLRQQGRVVAHVGIAQVELLLAGRRQSVTALHAVCVHPSFQGKGYGRRIMEMALEQVDAAGAPTTILWSEKSDFYARFDFERVLESAFEGTVVPQPLNDGCRRLDLDSAKDCELLRNVLATRTPVSNVAAAADDGWHFLIDLALWPEAASMLYWLEAEEALVVAEEIEGTLHLYDVIAQAPPAMARIAGAVMGGAEAMPCIVYVTPDRLDVDLQAVASPLEDWLHVRGRSLLPEEVAGKAFALSPFVRT